MALERLSTLFLVFAMFYQCWAAAVVPGIPNNQDEVRRPAHVTFRPIQSRSRGSRLNVQVRSFENIDNLELIPAPNVFTPDFEEYVATVNSQGKHVIKKLVTNLSAQKELESSLYINAAGVTSLFVKHRNDNLVLEGIVNSDMRITEDTSQQGTSKNGKVHHVAVKRMHKSRFACLTKSPNFPAKPNGRSAEGLVAAAETQSVPLKVQPEVFLVINYNFSAAFKHNIDDIKKYLGVFFNSVNRRFDTIETPKIQNVICGLLQIKDPSIENAFKVQGTPTIIDATETIDTFGRWLYSMKNSINKTYDVAVWLTSLDLGSFGNGAYNDATSGIAYVGTACQEFEDQYYKVALAEDNPNSYIGIHYVAHELAHLYGAPHDGDSAHFPPGNPGAERCPWSDGYIMSYEFGSSNKAHFSSCSVEVFAFMLNSGYGSCLTDTPKSAAVTLNSTLPGAIISLDNQCKLLNGDDHYFYTSEIDEICLKLWCAQNRNAGRVFVTSSGPALEGSPCTMNNTKWCINGVCTIK